MDADQLETNQQFLQAAADILSQLDIRYMEADLDEQLELRDELDRAMRNYSRTRLKILRQAVICTAEDIEEMQKIRDNLAQTDNFQQILQVALRFAGFLSFRFL
jgi:hypothetical protein